MSRRKGRVETTEYLQAARRFIRSAGRRVADDDPEDLAVLIQLGAVLEEAIQGAVDGQRERGFSWAEIAAPLGMTRQAAFQRWAPKVSKP